MSPRDITTAERMLGEFKFEFVKVASGSLVDKQLLKFLSRSGVPMIISTGMAWASEIDRAVRFIEDEGGNLQYILHAVSIYPCPPEKMNMRRIYTLQRLYGDTYKIGFSNHCKSIVFVIQAAAMGCEMIEFHFTVVDRTKSAEGDHRASIGMLGFDRIMGHLENMRLGLGATTISPYGEELDKGKNYRWRLAPNADKG